MPKLIKQNIGVRVGFFFCSLCWWEMGVDALGHLLLSAAMQARHRPVSRVRGWGARSSSAGDLLSDGSFSL